MISASKGKRQILPNPTADPAAAKMAPNLLPKFARSCCCIIHNLPIKIFPYREQK